MKQTSEYANFQFHFHFQFHFSISNIAISISIPKQVKHQVNTQTFPFPFPFAICISIPKQVKQASEYTIFPICKFDLDHKTAISFSMPPFKNTNSDFGIAILNFQNSQKFQPNTRSLPKIWNYLEPTK